MSQPDTSLAYNLFIQIKRVEDELRMLRQMAKQTFPSFNIDNLEYESQFSVGVIYHITPTSDFDPVSRQYLPQQYNKDGFIHCTRGADLMLMVANKYYRTVPGEFVLLIIDVQALTSPLKYEALDPEVPFPFPHIYGPLNRDAVIGILNMKRAPDGTFLVPPFLNV